MSAAAGVSDHRYRFIVLLSSAGGAVCLLLAYMRYSELASARGLDLRWVWQAWASVPAAFCVCVWLFQTRPWLRIAGVVSTLGVLAFSGWVLILALTSGSAGDMFGLVTLNGILALGVTVGWSAVGLLIAWATRSK